MATKYIDVEKLIAEIERLNSLVPYGNNDRHDEGLHDAYKAVKNVIDSLQQEQSEVDIEEEVKHYINENFTITDEIQEIPEEDRMYGIDKGDMLKIARHFYELGRNAREDELPEIELEKFTEKIKTFQGRYNHPEITSIKGAMTFMARMFYQYPNVARLWYEQLPKATMDDARKEEIK